MPKTIRPKNHEWYLVKYIGSGENPSPSGFGICQYVDGHFFDEQAEVTMDEYVPIIVKHLTHEK